MDFHSLEKCVQQFVRSKVAEEVDLDVKSVCVAVKHKSKKGSTLLAALWAKVLQHKHNFPKSTFPYKQRNDNGTEKLVVNTEDVTLTVFMKKGTLLIQGTYALDWSKKRLLQIMQNYDLPTDVKPGETDQDIKYPKEEFPPDRYHRYSRYATEKISPWDEEITPETTTSIPGTNLSWRNQTNEELYHPVTVKAQILTVHKGGSSSEEPGHFDEGQGEAAASGATDETKDADNRDEVVNSLISGMENLDIDVLSGGDLEEQLDLVKEGGLFDGPTFIYTLWRSLLHKWFHEGWKVYIITPFLDSKHLKDVVEIFFRNKNTAILEAFYVRRQCDDKRNITELKNDVLEMYPSGKQLSIQYQVFNKIIYPIKRFHGKLIAGVKDTEAEVMMTSANFHGNHFDADNLETVSMLRMSDSVFRQKYLNKLING